MGLSAELRAPKRNQGERQIHPPTPCLMLGGVCLIFGGDFIVSNAIRPKIISISKFGLPEKGQFGKIDSVLKP